MPQFLLKFWWSVSLAGVSTAKTERERKDIILINRAWLLLMVVQLTSVTSHIINGLHRSALLTGVLVLGLVGVHVLIRKNHVNAGKLAAVFVISYSTTLMGVFLGFDTHLIDLLLLASMMPLYLFEIKQKRMIFWGMALSVVPYALYLIVAPYISNYSLPLAEQYAIYKVTAPIKVLCLITLLYLIYHKNSAYEKEVHQKELQLVGQKKLYEMMLEQIPIDIVTFDKQLRYTYINSAAVGDPDMRQWLIGKSNQDYFQKRNLDLKLADERNKLLHEALEKEKAVRLEESFTDRRGQLKHTLKGASPIYNENGELLSLIGYSLDITGIKEAERKLKEYSVQLEQKNGDLQHFVNATSHDLKTPLRSIASYLQLLQRKNKEKLDEESLSLIDYSVKSVKQLNQLISDIYQYSVADRKQATVEITDLDKILADTVKQLGMFVTEKNAEISHKPLPVLKVTPAHMSLLFSNLVSNGIKYNASPKPQVYIDWTLTDKEYVISVKDNGIGIPEEYNKQVFEIFQRLHTSENYEGTGVGLAICKKIIDHYNGKMWVESKEGQGSTFFFSMAKDLVSLSEADKEKVLSVKKKAVVG